MLSCDFPSCVQRSILFSSEVNGQGKGTRVSGKRNRVKTKPQVLKQQSLSHVPQSSQVHPLRAAGGMEGDRENGFVLDLYFKKPSWLHISQHGYFPWLGKNATVFLFFFFFGNPLKYTSQYPSTCQTCVYVSVGVIYLQVRTLTVTLYFTLTLLPELESQKKQIKQKPDLYKQSFFFFSMQRLMRVSVCSQMCSLNQAVLNTCVLLFRNSILTKGSLVAMVG